MIAFCTKLVLLTLGITSAVFGQDAADFLFGKCGQRVGLSSGDEEMMNFMNGSAGDMIPVRPCNVTFYSKDSGYYIRVTPTKSYSVIQVDLVNDTRIRFLSSKSSDADTDDWKIVLDWSKGQNIDGDIGDDPRQIRIVYTGTLTETNFINLAFRAESLKNRALNLPLIIGASVGAFVAVVIIVVVVYCCCCRKNTRAY